MDEHVQPLQQPPGEPPHTVAQGRIFAPNAVGIATFLGSPIAGGIVLALNYRTLEKTGAAWAVIGATIAATALVVAIAAQIDLGTANSGIAVGLSFGMVAVAKGLHGKAYETHVAAGGKSGSSWLAVGIALPFLAGTVFMVVKFGFAPDVGKRYDFGGDQVVYYKDGVSRKQAGQVGKLLEEIAFFDKTGSKHVLTRREGSKGSYTYVVSFVLRSDVSMNDEIKTAFRQVGDMISERAFEGGKVVVRLVDGDLDELAELP